jgi:hypothetical protein
MKRILIMFFRNSFFAYIALILCFSSVVFVEYAHHDNTRYFRGIGSDTFKSSCFNEGQYTWLYFIGRPITAEIECQVFKRTRLLSDLSEMRLLVIGVISFSTAVMGLILIGIGLDWVTALAISIAIFTLPGMQNAAFMSNFPNAITSFFALLAFFLLTPIKPVSPLAWNRGDAIRIGLSFSLLVLTSLMYPAISFVFFWGSIARALTDRCNGWSHHVKWFLRDTIVFGSAMFTGIVLSKVIAPEIFEPAHHDLPDSYQLDLSINAIFEKIPFLLNEVIPSAANLWFIYNGYVGSFLIGALLLLITIIVINHSLQPANVRITIKPIAFLVLLLFFTFTPLMLPKNPVILQRVIFPGMGAILLISIFVISRVINEIFPTINSLGSTVVRFGAFALLGIGLLTANYTQTQNVWNTNYEMIFIRDELAKYETLPRHIHLVRPIGNNIGFNGLPSIEDEFNKKTTDYKSDIDDLVRISLYGSSRSLERPTSLCDPITTNCEIMVPRSHTIISFSDYGESFCRTNDMAVVDLNILVRATHTGTPDLVDIDSIPYCDSAKYHVITDSHSDEKYFVGKAFDNSVAPADFWETSITKPITLDITYVTPIALESYSLSGGEASERMPISWVLYGSEDLKTWAPVDTRENESQWTPNEKRLYKLTRLTSYKHFRFVFKRSFDSEILRIYEIKLNESPGELKVN